MDVLIPTTSTRHPSGRYFRNIMSTTGLNRLNHKTYAYGEFRMRAKGGTRSEGVEGRGRTPGLVQRVCFDVTILGTAPEAYACAHRLVKSGKRVLVVEKLFRACPVRGGELRRVSVMWCHLLLLLLRIVCPSSLNDLHVHVLLLQLASSLAPRRLPLHSTNLDPTLANLCVESMSSWRRLDSLAMKRSGSLVEALPALDLGPLSALGSRLHPSGGLGSHLLDGGVESLLDVSARIGLKLDPISLRQLPDLFPMFRGHPLVSPTPGRPRSSSSSSSSPSSSSSSLSSRVDSDMLALLQQDGAIVDADRALRCMRDVCRRAGVVVEEVSTLVGFADKVSTFKLRLARPDDASSSSSFSSSSSSGLGEDEIHVECEQIVLAAGAALSPGLASALGLSITPGTLRVDSLPLVHARASSSARFSSSSSVSMPLCMYHDPLGGFTSVADYLAELEGDVSPGGSTSSSTRIDSSTPSSRSVRLRADLGGVYGARGGVSLTDSSDPAILFTGKDRKGQGQPEGMTRAYGWYGMPPLTSSPSSSSQGKVRLTSLVRHLSNPQNEGGGGGGGDGSAPASSEWRNCRPGRWLEPEVRRTIDRRVLRHASTLLKTSPVSDESTTAFVTPRRDGNGAREEEEKERRRRKAEERGEEEEEEEDDDMMVSLGGGGGGRKVHLVTTGSDGRPCLGCHPGLEEFRMVLVLPCQGEASPIGTTYHIGPRLGELAAQLVLAGSLSISDEDLVGFSRASLRPTTARAKGTPTWGRGGGGGGGGARRGGRGGRAERHGGSSEQRDQQQAGAAGVGRGGEEEERIRSCRVDGCRLVGSRGGLLPWASGRGRRRWVSGS